MQVQVFEYPSQCLPVLDYAPQSRQIETEKVDVCLAAMTWVMASETTTIQQTEYCKVERSLRPSHPGQRVGTAGQNGAPGLPDQAPWRRLSAAVCTERTCHS